MKYKHLHLIVVFNVEKFLSADKNFKPVHQKQNWVL